MVPRDWSTARFCHGPKNFVCRNQVPFEIHRDGQIGRIKRVSRTPVIYMSSVRYTFPIQKEPQACSASSSRAFSRVLIASSDDSVLGTPAGDDSC